MRVVIFSDRYLPRLSGPEIVAHGFAAGLARRGHEVTVVTATEGPAGHRVERALDGVRILHGRTRPDFARYLADADAVLTQLSWAPQAAEACPAGVPLIVLCHSPQCVRRTAQLTRPATLVFPTRAAAEDAPSGARVLVIAPPIDRARLAPAASAVRDAVLQINLADAKGGAILELLAERQPERHFVAIHGGYGEQRIPAGRNVEVVAPQDGVAELYARARVVLVPSHAETFSLVGVEAQFAGCAVIASDLPALRESLGEGALFVPPNMPLRWLDALCSLDDETAWRELVERGTANAARYDADESARLLEEEILRSMSESAELIQIRAPRREVCPPPQRPAKATVRAEPILCDTGAPGQSAFAQALCSELGFRSVPLADLEPWLWQGIPVLCNGWWPEFGPLVERYPGLFHIVWHSGWSGSDLMGETKMLDAAMAQLDAGRIKLYWLDRRDTPPPGAQHLTPIWSPRWLERTVLSPPPKRPGAVMAGLHGKYPTSPKNILATVRGCVGARATVHLGQTSLSGPAGPALGRLLHGHSHEVHPPLARTDLLRLLASMELLVHPSLSETWPVMIMEAIYLGTPVVTSEVCVFMEALPPDVAELCVVRPATATGQLASKVRHLLDRPGLREQVLAAQRAALDALYPVHLAAIRAELTAAGFPIAEGGAVQTGDVTVFVLTTGEPSTEECLRRLRAQDLDFELKVIRDTAPMHVAFQRMLDECATPYFVQVDADMLFTRPDGIRRLVQQLRDQPDTVALFVDWLWDESVMRPIQGVKAYRHAICARFPYRDTLSCEVTQLAEMKEAGFVHVAAPLPVRAADCAAVHHGCQTPRLAFQRWKSLGQKHANLPWMGWLCEHIPGLMTRLLDAPGPVNRASLLGLAAGLGAPDIEERERDFRELAKDRGFDLLWRYFGEGADPDRYDRDADEIMAAAGRAAAKAEAEKPVVEDPVELTLYLTAKCNHKCGVCHRQLSGAVKGLDWIAPGETEPRIDMEPALVRNILATFPSLKGACLAGFGEPLCHPQLDEIVQILDGAGRHMGLITNGSLLWDRREMVERWPLVYLTVSLLAVTPEEHRDAAGVGTWESVVKGLDHFARRTKHNLGASFVVHRGNVHRAPEYLAFAQAHGLRYVHLINVLPHGDPDDQWFLDHVLTVDCPEAEIVRGLGDLPGAELLEARPQLVNLNGPPPRNCQSPFVSLGVNSWGHTSLCRRVEPPEVYRGNHFQTENVWRDDQNTKLRLAMLGKLPLPRRCTRCFGCWSQ